MAARDHLSETQFDEIPLEHYGVSVVPAWKEHDLRKFHEEDLSRNGVHDVPIEHIHGGQQHVDWHGVAKHRDRDPGVLTGAGLPDGKGVMLRDGHHRLAAAKLRGDKSLKVNIEWSHGRDRRQPR